VVRTSRHEFIKNELRQITLIAFSTGKLAQWTRGGSRCKIVQL